MNAKTVESHIKTTLGIEASVKGERAGKLRFFSIVLPNENDHGRASEVKSSVEKLIKDKGFGGCCDVKQPFGAKLA